MLKTFFLTLIVFLLPSSAMAQKLNFTSFYPSPSGNFKTIRLVPQPALPSSNCQLGTMYANADDGSIPYFCINAGGPFPEFRPLSGPWTLTGDNLHLTDTADPLNKKVGVGTTTPPFKLTLLDDGGILADHFSGSLSTVSQISGSAMLWYPLKGAFRVFTVAGTWVEDASIGLNSMAMGGANTASGTGSAIWGGTLNEATGTGSTVTGGNQNIAAGDYASIIGGNLNAANGAYSRVSGQGNTAYAYSAVGGGQNNTAGSPTNNYAVVNGGQDNSATGVASVVSGGHANTAPANYATITGGLENQISADSTYATISGGFNNSISPGTHAVIGGGQNNSTSGNYTTISGGTDNTITASAYATISGGSENTAACNGGYCSISGGSENQNTGNFAVVLGGIGNQALQPYAMVPGGEGNIANGAYAFVGGRNMNYSGYRTFLWGHSATPTAAVTQTNVFIIATGSMGIRDITPNAILEVNGNDSADDYLRLSSNSSNSGDVFVIKNNGYVGSSLANPTHPLEFGNGAYVDAAGNFVNASSRAYKTDIQNLSLESALAAFKELSPVSFYYQNQPDHRYLGFIAEDVPELVAEEGRDGLSPMEIATVLSRVVREQQQTLDEQKSITLELLAEIDRLKSSFEHMKLNREDAR